MLGSDRELSELERWVKELEYYLFSLLFMFIQDTIFISVRTLSKADKHRVRR